VFKHGEKVASESCYAALRFGKGRKKDDFGFVTQEEV